MHADTLTAFIRLLDVARPWRGLVAVLRRFAAPAHDRPDAAALRDLGLDASEWRSIQAEAAGRIEATRRRAAGERDATRLGA